MNNKFRVFSRMLIPVYAIQKIFYKTPYVHSIEDTLKRIENDHVSISRYGDGDFDQIFGIAEGYQKTSKKMAHRLKEILRSNLPGHIVCIPNVYHGLGEFSVYSRDWIRFYMVKNIKRLSTIIDYKKDYYNSYVSRCYREISHPEKAKDYFDAFKRIFAGKKLLVIEGEKTRLGVGNDIFHKAETVQRILCPAENAFEKYDSIFSEIQKFSKDYLVIIALGPTATILAYDLHKCGYRALDLGHFDLEYEWYLRGLSQKSSNAEIIIEGKYVNEARSSGGIEVPECKDPKYISEIVLRIE